MTNFNAISRRKWRDARYYVENVETFRQLPGGLPKRSDLFGFVDMLAIPSLPDTSWVFIQITSRANMSTRVRKILRQTTGTGRWATPMRQLAHAILARGDKLLVEGWWQEAPGRIWQCRERFVTLEEVLTP